MEDSESPKKRQAMGGDGRDEGQEGRGGGQPQPQPQMTMTMPVGFRFAPTDEQLVSWYLKERLRGASPSPWMEGLVVDFDIYGCNPWELPRHLFTYPGVQQGIMYFFTPTHSPAKSSSGRGQRVGRTAGCGVWHGTGKDTLIRGFDTSTGRPGVVVGHTTSFKFEVITAASASSSANKRIKTDWLMHEYRLHPTATVRGHSDTRRGSVICKIYYKGCCSRQPGDDGDGHWPQPQHQPQPQPKRKRAVDVPPEQAISWADAADPFSPDTPLMICNPQESEPDLILIDDDEDRMPAAKRRRVAQQPPEDENPELDHQEEEGPPDAAFAPDLDPSYAAFALDMLDTDDLPSPPMTLPPPAPDAHNSMAGSADASAPADPPPSMPSSSDDPFAMLSADALPSPTPLPSSPPSMSGVDPLDYWADFAGCSRFGPEVIPLLDDPLQCSADLPSPPPLPSSAPDAQLMTGADTGAAADQSGCPPSMSPADAPALQPQGMLSTYALPSLPPLPSPPPSMAGVDPPPCWADFADDWRFVPDGTPLGSFPLLDDTSSVPPSFQGYSSSFWHDPHFF